MNRPCCARLQCPHAHGICCADGAQCCPSNHMCVSSDAGHLCQMITPEFVDRLPKKHPQTDCVGCIVLPSRNSVSPPSPSPASKSKKLPSRSSSSGQSSGSISSDESANGSDSSSEDDEVEDEASSSSSNSQDEPVSGGTQETIKELIRQEHILSQQAERHARKQIEYQKAQFERAEGGSIRAFHDKAEYLAASKLVWEEQVAKHNEQDEQQYEKNMEYMATQAWNQYGENMEAILQ